MVSRNGIWKSELCRYTDGHPTRYIVDGKTGGVIVFLFLWIFLAFYFVLKFPKLLVVALLSLVTAVLM